MRRWLIPLALGLVLAIVAYNVTLMQYPRIAMSTVTAGIARAGHGYNALFIRPLPDDKHQYVVRPSPDLAYSSCPFDVSDGPVLVDVQPVPSPYWSLSVFDGRTDVAFVRNNIDANGQPIRIAIALAGQPVPNGMQAVRVKDATGIALIRVLILDRAQFATIDAARQKSSCKPLS